MKIIEKDILTVEEGYIIHQVNCLGKMNSGVAKAIREKYPKVFDQYINFTEAFNISSNALGYKQFVVINDKLDIVNLFGQNNYGYDGKRYTRYSAWEKALPEIYVSISCFHRFTLYFLTKSV